MTDGKMSAEVIAVEPNKVKIMVYDLEDFKIAEQDLQVGSYLQISDTHDVALIAIVESFSIDLIEQTHVDKEGKKTKETERRYVIQANPLGTLVNDKFTRGGDSLSIPPTAVKPAENVQIEKIYKESIDEKDRFTFAKLAQRSDINVPVDGNYFFNKHVAIVGSTGSGKSHTVAKIIQEAVTAKEGQYDGLNNSHVVIFDIHSEYKTAFPKANVISIDNLVLPYWLLNSEELEEMFLESGDMNNYNQASVLRTVVIENKRKNNSSASKVYFDSPIQFDIDEVINCLQNLRKETRHTDDADKIMLQTGTQTFATEKDKLLKYFEAEHEFQAPQRANATAGREGISKGMYADGTLDKFINRFVSKAKSERLKFLFGASSKSVSFEDTIKQFIGYKDSSNSNVTIIDLSGVPFEVLSITVSLISRLLFEYGYYYKRIKGKGKSDTPLLVVYEEAHKYAPKNEAARYRASRTAIERIAKEGRKYGVSLAIVSQRPSEISETIFSQCNNFIAMRLTNPEDQNYVKRLLPDTLGSITDMLPTLKSGEALLIGDAIVMPCVVKIDLCDPEPSSGDMPYLDEWKKVWQDVDFGTLKTEWQS